MLYYADNGRSFEGGFIGPTFRLSAPAPMGGWCSGLSQGGRAGDNLFQEADEARAFILYGLGLYQAVAD